MAQKPDLLMAHLAGHDLRCDLKPLKSCHMSAIGQMRLYGMNDIADCVI